MDFNTFRNLHPIPAQRLIDEVASDGRPVEHAILCIQAECNFTVSEDGTFTFTYVTPFGKAVYTDGQWVATEI